MDESVKASPLDIKPTPVTPPPLKSTTLSLRPIYLTLTIIASVLLGVGGYAGYREYIRVIQPAPAPLITPTPTPEATSWNIYSNAMRRYTIRYPRDWSIDATRAETPIEDVEGATLVLQKGSYKLTIYWPAAFGPGICIFDDQSRVGVPEMANFCEGQFTKIQSDDHQNTFRRLVAPEISSDYAQWEVYTKMDDAYVTVPLIRYQARIDYDANMIDTMDRMLASFTITSPPAYSCPKTEWVDCMPGPDKPQKTECTNEFLTWAKANCPGFQGAAL